MSDPRQPQFWDEEEGDLWGEVAGLVIDAYFDGALSGASALPANLQPLVSQDFINQAALQFVKDYRFTTIKGISDTTRAQVQQAMSNWMLSGAPLDVLEKQLSNIFGEARAAAIAATETTRAYAAGNLASWEATEVVEGGKVMNAEDDAVCPICEEHAGETVAVDDTDSAPPFHTNCRCWLQPVVSEEMLGKKLEAILNA